MIIKRSQNFWLAAFYLSKYGISTINNKCLPPVELKTKYWKNAYSLFFENLGDGRSIKAFENSLKNARDSFDSHLKDSNRIGWKSKSGNGSDLPDIALFVYNKYNELDRKFLWKQVKSLISGDLKLSISSSRSSNVALTQIKGRNPDWNREELILALDLYFNLEHGQMHKGNIEVIALSKLLRDLNTHEIVADPQKFRNPSGISRRLGNFKTMDSGYSGEGLTNSGKLAKEIWDEFVKDKRKLKLEAGLIRNTVLQLSNLEDKKEDLPIRADRLSFNYNYHKNLESNPLTIELKINETLNTRSGLECSICKFSFHEYYGEIGRGLIEIHFDKNLDTKNSYDRIDLDDFILVCGNCHKIIDKYYSAITSTDLKNLIKD
ncbi:HNH endonuclease [Pedobacter caeni]|uniref:5-methylcytosine-specific restriction enzyme A n=1 Tax=Pedobacter caeni TaxID=288992 RepID=A0A1M5JP71_9SPHI|nr:hypothetical protein [Pedobacter caeni]SHG42080.1 5-methylcytosine-specific restriction enzyme A [Pedobacter caeni]